MRHVYQSRWILCFLVVPPDMCVKDLRRGYMKLKKEKLNNSVNAVGVLEKWKRGWKRDERRWNELTNPVMFRGVMFRKTKRWKEVLGEDE